jgi:hypothetical protein
MSKFILPVLSAGLAVVVALSCGDGSSGPSGPSGDDWFPLSVGNTWHYIIDGYVIAYIDTVDADGTLDRDIMSLVSHQQGFDLYECRTISSITFYPDTGMSWTVTETTFVYLYEDSTEVRAYDDTVETDHELLAVLPLEVGNTWYSYDDSAYVCEVMSLSASVTVPAGSFSDCAHILTTDSTQTEYSYNSYLHQGIGLVKEVIDDLETLGATHLEIDLDTYNLN